MYALRFLVNGLVCLVQTSFPSLERQRLGVITDYGEKQTPVFLVKRRRPVVKAMEKNGWEKNVSQLVPGGQPRGFWDRFLPLKRDTSFGTEMGSGSPRFPDQLSLCLGLMRRGHSSFTSLACQTPRPLHLGLWDGTGTRSV